MAATKPTRRPNLPKPSETSVTITIGLMNTICSLHPIQDTSNQRATKLVTLDPGLHRVEQFYLCDAATVTFQPNGDRQIAGGCRAPAGQVGFKLGDLKDKGREQGKNQPVLALTAAEVLATKGSKLDPNILDLVLCPLDEVQGVTWPHGTAYWVEPARADAFYLALCEKMAEGNLAAVGTINLRDKDKFVRLLPHNGGLVMQEMLRPGDTWVFEPVEGEIPERFRSQMNTLFELATEDFDPDAFESENVAAMRALIDAKASGQPVGTITPIRAAAATQDDTEAQLEASLAFLAARKKAS